MTEQTEPKVEKKPDDLIPVPRWKWDVVRGLLLSFIFQKEALMWDDDKKWYSISWDVLSALIAYLSARNDADLGIFKDDTNEETIIFNITPGKFDE